MCATCGAFVLLESYADLCICGLHEGAAVGGWTCVSAVSCVSGRVSLGCPVSVSGVWVKALELPQHQEDGRRVGLALGGGGRSHASAHPSPASQPPTLQRGSSQDSPLGQEAPNSTRENQRLQKLRFPDSCLGLRAHSWLLDSISKKNCQWQPWFPRERAHHGLAIQAFLGHSFILLKEERNDTSFQLTSNN